jgi:hypothetical protein
MKEERAMKMTEGRKYESTTKEDEGRKEGRKEGRTMK